MLSVALFATALLLATIGPKPPQLVNVFPHEGSTHAVVEVIGAELDLARGDRVDPASLRLLVDGADVTSRSKITQTRDWPASSASIFYAPIELQAGVHRAEVAFRTEAGMTLRYTWCFTSKRPGREGRLRLNGLALESGR